MAAILVYLNKETAAILVSQNTPRGIDLHFSANVSYFFSKSICPLVTTLVSVLYPSYRMAILQ